LSPRPRSGQGQASEPVTPPAGQEWEIEGPGYDRRQVWLWCARYIPYEGLTPGQHAARDALRLQVRTLAAATGEILHASYAGFKPANMDAEDILALLTRAGFSGPDALHIYRALFGFLHGHVLDELQELTVSPDETDDLLRLGLHRLPVSEFPLLRGLAPVLAAYDGAAELERGLDILLTWLTATLTPPGQACPR
jgi:hypothetical protein